MYLSKLGLCDMAPLFCSGLSRTQQGAEALQQVKKEKGGEHAAGTCQLAPSRVAPLERSQRWVDGLH